MSNEIRKEFDGAIKSSDVEKLQAIFAELGVLAEKSLGLNEEMISQDYLQTIHDLYRKIVVHGSLVEDDVRKIGKIAFGHNYRIYQVAVSGARDGYVEEIANLLQTDLDVLAQQSVYTTLLPVLLDSYGAHIAFALERRHPSRAGIFQQLIQLVFPDPFKPHAEEFKVHYLTQTLDRIGEIFERTRETSDFVLWDVIQRATPGMSRMYNELVEELGSPVQFFGLNVPSGCEHLAHAQQAIYWLAHTPQSIIGTAIRDRHPMRTKMVLAYSRHFPFVLPGIQQQSVEGAFLGIYLANLRGVFVELIQSGDFELWRRATESFGHFLSLEDLYNRILGCLMRMQEPSMHPYHLLATIQPRIDAYNSSLLKARLENFASYDNERSETEALLNQIDYDTRLVDMFLEVCSFAIGQNKSEYVRELWVQSNELAGYRLTHFDVGFLMYPRLLSYVTVGVIPPIRDRGDDAPYLLQYYLLCLARALPHSRFIWCPPIQLPDPEILAKHPELGAPALDELRRVYTYLHNLPHLTRKLLDAYPAVANDLGEWSTVFQRDAGSALETVRDWLESPALLDAWQETQEELVRSTSLDKESVDAYKLRLLHDYRAQSVMGQWTTSSDEVPQPDFGKTATIAYRENLDKVGFTILERRPQSSNTAYVFCSNEIKLFLMTIAGHHQVKPVSIGVLELSIIQEEVARLAEGGAANKLFLLVPPLRSLIHNVDSQFKARIQTDQSGIKNLILDDDTAIRIVERGSAGHVFLLDQSAVYWKYRSSVEANVEICATNSLKVDVELRGEVICALAKPEAVAVWVVASTPNSAQASSEDQNAPSL